VNAYESGNSGIMERYHDVLGKENVWRC
jgi:hypothetical protein